jgi:hypothetical protein
MQLDRDLAPASQTASCRKARPSAKTVATGVSWTTRQLISSRGRRELARVRFIDGSVGFSGLASVMERMRFGVGP